MRHGKRAGDDNLGRLARRHPLRRRAERIRHTARGLAALLGIGVAASAVAAGVVVFHTVRDPDRAVSATTEAQAYLRPSPVYGVMARWAAPIIWRDAAGVAHRGTVDVSSRLPAGVRVPAGLSAAGTLRHQPPPIADAWVRALLTGGVLAGAGVLVARRALPAAHRTADRAQLDSWDQSWAQWNAHHT